LGLTYLTDIALTFQLDYVPELAHLWTLAVEEHFYVIWPIALIGLLRLAPGRRLTWLVRLMFIAVVLRLATLALAPPLGLFFYASPTLWVDSLLAGAACAIVVHDRPDIADRIKTLVRMPVAAVVAGAIIFGFALAPESFTWPGTYVLGIPALAASACVILLGVGEGLTPRVERVLTVRPLVLLGSLSYALYLYNSTCIMLAERVWGESLSVRLAGAGVALALALVSRRMVERPALRFKERWRSPARLGAAEEYEKPGPFGAPSASDLGRRPQPSAD
jgi:peptidoglycan/LPS O-acetylase OafA/YrhL